MTLKIKRYLFNKKLEIDNDKMPNLFRITEGQPERMEKHLVGLAKQSYNTDKPTQEQINSVATFMEHDLKFE